MSTNHSEVTFCIPLLPQAVSTRWDIVVTLLQETLRSLTGQLDKRFSVIIAGHECPIDVKNYPFSIKFIEATWKPEKNNDGKLRDKRWKRKLLYQGLRERGGGYAMFLDADDLVSHRLVKYVLEHLDPYGYLITTGYALDRTNWRIAPIPGVWSGNFDTVCGSCAVINFRPDDLPAKGDKEERLAGKLMRHSEWKDVMREAGRPLQVLPFPAAVYVLNHSQNLHSSIVLDREIRVPSRIERESIKLSTKLAAEFSLSLDPIPT